MAQFRLEASSTKTHRQVQVSTASTTSILDGGVSAPLGPTPEVTSHGLASGRKAPKGAGKRVTLRSTKRDVTGGQGPEVWKNHG